MTGHTLTAAARIINQRTWSRHTARHLRDWLHQHGHITRDITGLWITTTQADRRLIYTRWGMYPKPMPNGITYMHSASIRLTDAGLAWLEQQIQRATSAA